MFFEKEKSGAKFFQSSILDDDSLVHAFSTRLGGNTLSPMHYFSMGTAGMPEFKKEVDKNRIKLCNILDLNYQKLIIPDQKHTDNIVVIKNNSNFDLKETDGVITDQDDLPIMLLFADCTPVILFEPQKRILGVIHAGWRGTAKGIVSKAVKIFIEEFNAAPELIKAAIGPAIGQCCYPVSEDVAEQLRSSIKKDCDNIFIKAENTGKINVDLKKLNAQQLVESGVLNIDVMGYCTSCNNSLFYSYRADNGKTGRHCAVASIKGQR